MKGRYKLAAVLAAALIIYSVVSASLLSLPQTPVVMVDLPDRVCIEAGCLYPQVFAVIVYASSPPGSTPFLDIKYFSPGSKALFTIPTSLYDAWAGYLVSGGNSSIPSIGVVILGYTSNVVTYAIKVVTDISSPLSPLYPGTKDVIVSETDFRAYTAEPPPIPGYGSPKNMPAGLRWGDVARTGISTIDDSPILINSGLREAADSPYVRAPVTLSEGGERLSVMATPVTVSSSDASSISAYLSSGLYAIVLTYRGLPLYVIGVVETKYAGALAAVNDTISLNISMSAWVSGTYAVPLLYPLNLSTTILYWVPSPLASIESVNFSLVRGGECVEAPMKVGGGEVVVRLGQAVEGLYLGEVVVQGSSLELRMEASLYPLGADAAVIVYSGSPVVEAGIKRGIPGGLCVIGHEKSGWGGGCVGGFCPG